MKVKLMAKELKRQNKMGRTLVSARCLTRTIGGETRVRRGEKRRRD